MDHMRIGFIGLGTMGIHMARHLLEAEFDLTVHNRTKQKAEPLLAAGAFWAETPAALAARVDVVMTCLTDGKAVEQVLLGQDGVVAGAQPNLIVIDMSTIAPSHSCRLADDLHGHGIDMLDAPVSGGDVGARDASLVIMVGGSIDGYNAVEQILQILGKTVRHVGFSGAGQRLKLCNQIMCAGHMLTLCEMLTFAEHVGVDPQMVLEIIGQGAGESWALRNLGPKILSGELDTGFAIDLMLKDLLLVSQEAIGCELPLHVTERARSLFAMAKRLAAERSGDTRLATQGMILAHRELVRS